MNSVVNSDLDLVLSLSSLDLINFSAKREEGFDLVKGGRLLITINLSHAITETAAKGRVSLTAIGYASNEGDVPDQGSKQAFTIFVECHSIWKCSDMSIVDQDERKLRTHLCYPAYLKASNEIRELGAKLGVSNLTIKLELKQLNFSSSTPKKKAGVAKKRRSIDKSV